MPIIPSVFGPKAAPYGTTMAFIVKQSPGISYVLATMATPIELVFFYIPGPAAAASSVGYRSSFG